MSERLLRLLTHSAIAALLAMNVAVPAFADAKPTPKPVEPPAKPTPVKEAADQPAIKLGRDEGKSFLARHEGFLKDLKAMDGKVDLLLVGDSITDGWRRGGKNVFDAAFPKSTLNIGIGGDRTQHVIWRLQNGEVEGIKPKVAMLMIGTNNLSSNSDEEIVAGIKKCVSLLREKLPETKVLLLGVFPRAAKPEDAARSRIKNINSQIAKLDDGGKTVKYLDIGEQFLDKDGNLPKEIMPDALHPNQKGYQIWADAVKPTLEGMMK